MVSKKKEFLRLEFLEALYDRYHDRSFVHPDPLETLYDFSDERDVEIAGFIAASLAYGRVAQILKSLHQVFAIMGGEPRRYLSTRSPQDIRQDFSGFCHRFCDDEKMAAFLIGIKTLLQKRGSLRRAFDLGDTGADTMAGLQSLVEEMLKAAPVDPGHLLTRPEKGSACKRLHLFLRWMVRKDRVDPGIWENVGTERLLVPLDVHMQRMAGFLGLCTRKNADIRSVREITAAFAQFSPKDPVRYDFALTRAGIRENREPMAFLSEFQNLVSHNP